MKRLLAILLSIIVFSMAMPIKAQAARKPLDENLDTLDVYGYCDYQEAFKAFDCVNQYRQDYGRQPLKMDRTLMEIAMCRAAECAVYYSHARPNADSSEATLTSQVTYYDGVAYCYEYFRALDVGGENLTAQCIDGTTAALSWYNSKAHRDNFLYSAISTGVGCFRYTDIWIFIQIFAGNEPLDECFASDFSSTPVLRTVKVQALNGTDGWSKRYNLFTDIVDLEYSKQQYSAQSCYHQDETDQIVLRVKDGREDFATVVIDPSKVTYSSGSPDKVSVDENGIFTVLVNEDTTVTLYTEYQGKKYPVTITLKKKTQPVQPIVVVQPEEEEPETDDPETTEDEEPVLNGWQTINNRQYFYDCGRSLTGWQRINGKWYLFAYADGRMLTGWVKSGGKWYYMNGSGVMQVGWRFIKGKWYYMNGSGAMQTGWRFIKGKWYYMNGSGAMQTGWLKSGSKWYYLNASGAMQTGWLRLGGRWYYLNGSGAMQTGWKRINGTRYYFYSSGALR